MNKIILLFFLSPFLVFGQATRPILSKLIDYSIEKTPVHCGYQLEYGVLKFELQESVENFRKGDIIFIVQQCPKEIMEMSVGKYENNHVYLLSISQEADKKYIEIGNWQCEKFYPKDKPEKFWRGNILKVQ